jgi:putative ABC transport system permease protein
VRRALDSKLLRDLRTLRGQVIAIALILAAGVASFVCTLTAYEGLKSSRDVYYARYRMPELFSPVKKAPLSVVSDLGQLPGVRRARGRIVFDVTVDLPQVIEPISGRMISMPDRRQEVLADVHLLRGRWFEGDGTGQVIVAERFAIAHELEVGDRLSVVMNDRKESLAIVGIGLSPEYVYMVRGVGELLPDDKHFTIATTCSPRSIATPSSTMWWTSSTSGWTATEPSARTDSTTSSATACCATTSTPWKALPRCCPSCFSALPHSCCTW